MNKLIFIIGMRRSGTSILRKLIMQHPDVKHIEFEPNELFEIAERIDIPRYRNISFFTDTIMRFKHHANKYYGAKLAINPGIEGMRWKNLIDKFPEAKFVFISRDPKCTYQSWINIETSKRGTCVYSMYLDWWKHINWSFAKFAVENRKKAVTVKYKRLLENTDSEMKKIWNLLNLQPIKGLNYMVKLPKYGC